MLRRITAQEEAWVQSQPIIGDPILTRLHRELRRAGFIERELALTDGGEGLELRLVRSAGLQELNHDLMTRLLISVLRRAGFEVGFSEVAILDMDDERVDGFSYVAPLDQLFHGRPPQIEP